MVFLNTFSLVSYCHAKLSNAIENFKNNLCFFCRAATILRLLGNETIQFNARGKKSEPGFRKQLNTDVKSTTKFNFFL